MLKNLFKSYKKSQIADALAQICFTIPWTRVQ